MERVVVKDPLSRVGHTHTHTTVIYRLLRTSCKLGPQSMQQQYATVLNGVKAKDKGLGGELVGNTHTHTPGDLGRARVGQAEGLCYIDPLFVL